MLSPNSEWCGVHCKGCGLSERGAGRRGWRPKQFDRTAVVSLQRTLICVLHVHSVNLILIDFLLILYF